MSVKQLFDTIILVLAVISIGLAILVEFKGGNGFELFCIGMLLSLHIQVSRIYDRN